MIEAFVRFAPRHGLVHPSHAQESAPPMKSISESPTLELSGWEKAPGPASDRAVGLVFAAATAVVGLWPATGGAAPRAWALATSVAFVVAAAAKPGLLAPLSKAWFRLGLALHRIASPIVLALIYFLAIVPTGLLLRLFGKDVLRLRFDARADSYWVLREPVSSESMKNQY